MQGGKRRLTVARFVRVLENLASGHVAHAVAEESARGDDGFLRAAGYVRGDESPGEEEGEDVRHRDKVQTLE